MSSLSNNIYGSSANKGVGGLLSGLDTDELVKQMSAATRNKINRQYQSKQKLLYRQESYREISTKLLSFSNKYFSYSSGSKTNILSSNFFQSYTYESSSSYVNVSGNVENIKNFSIDSISQVATAASFASNKEVTDGKVESDSLSYYVSPLAGETMTLECDGKTYNIKLDNDFGRSLKSSSGLERPVTHADVVEELNEQLAKIEGNEESTIIKFKLDDTGVKIILDESNNRDKEAKLIAASKNITDVLKMKVGEVATSSEDVVVKDLTVSHKDIYSDPKTNITFEYNGVAKKIDFNEEIQKAPDVVNHLNSELEKAFGAGKVTVKLESKKIIFEVDGDTNIFGISTISKDFSNLTGLESGDYNRLNKNKAITELGFDGITEENALELSEGRKGFKIKINDVDIEIESTMSVTDVINKINNNAEAGVKVYYSSTTNTFSVKATETGTHKGVNISGNLAEALFGMAGTDGEDFRSIEDLLENKLNSDSQEYRYDEITKTFKILSKDEEGKEIEVGSAKLEGKKVSLDINGKEEEFILRDYLVKPGTDTIMTYTLNGVESTVTRSTANFTIDEINIELNEKAAGLKKEDPPITFDVTNNSDEVVTKVKEFVDAYNEIINLISTKTSEKPKRDYPPLTPEQQEEMEESEIKSWTEEAKKGVLFGDRNMTTLVRKMRGTMTGITDVSSITLSSIGISAASMDTSGKLVLDEKKFKEKLLDNPDEIARLFTNTSGKTGQDAKSGIAIQLQSIIRDNVGAYGTTGLLIEEAGMPNSMTSDRNFISEKMKDHEDKMTELKRDLEVERQRYWKQFSSLEQSLNKLNSQSSWFTDMMGQ